MDLEQRKQRAESLRGREVRTAPVTGFELRETSSGVLNMTGWASVTERDYDMSFYTERIKRGAFAETLSANPDVQLLVNHEGLPLARTIGGSLRLSEDERGLHVDADLDPTDPEVQRLAPKVARGLNDQMSFAFSGAKSNWDEDYTQREIVGLSIHRGDVSIVNQGANPTTSFQFNSAHALDFLRGLPEDELAAILRSLTPEAVEPPAPPAAHDLELFRARAFALRARG